MVLVLLVGAAIGAFVHLRSVDPGAERDRLVADGILERLRGAGLAVQPQGSAPALRAGFRQNDMKFRFLDAADETGGSDGEAETEADLPTECSFVSGAQGERGFVDRLYDRLFGVGDQSDKEVTSFASAGIGAAGSPLESGVTIVVLFTMRSSDSAREVATALGSPAGRECLAGSFSAGAGGTARPLTPLPLPIEGSVGFRGEAGLPGGVAASFDLVAIQRGRGVAFLMSGGLAPPQPEAHLTVLGPLAAGMAAGLADEPG